MAHAAPPHKPGHAAMRITANARSRGALATLLNIILPRG